MFAKEIYESRRAILKSKVQSGLILFLGNEEAGMNFKNNTYTFRQDSTFLYYTGLDKASLTFLIDVDNNQEILFGDNISIDDIVWFGPTPKLEEDAAKAGIIDVRPTKDLQNYLDKASNSGNTIHYLPPYRDEHILKLQQWLHISPKEAAAKPSVELIKAVVSMRSYKQPEEIVEIDKAVDISTEMHETFMKLTKPGLMESYVAGKLHGMALCAGGDLSYPIILTVNGETLHIHARHHEMKAGQLALCDAGAETPLHYAGDLTRTVPVNGKFTSLQKDMYNIVLDTQLKTIEACKPGTLFKDIHALAGETLLEGLKGFGIIKGDVKEAVANDVHTLFFQCGLGHMMGMDVHDMENLGEQYVGYTDTMKKIMTFGWKSLRLGKALEPGFVVTIEPGLYFIPSLIDEWKAENKLSQFVDYNELDKFRDFSGIRIEDDILITETGHRILGNTIAPKSVEEIESFMAN
ncbi:aminopeptidase P family protein [Rhizosphaericola mali]|uniref:Xaa-Pro aminopeptidase n=1 Tax=Rhizosphaericola mali TaxID=2545455 RepID=A0A5P2GCB0_9BACT|nr:aminopeptidase P family protein [Rhizosphaericola mali]QES90853.1 aminopeptidase P family protein [Rhizosphaericola mali]